MDSDDPKPSGELTPVEAARDTGRVMGFWDHLNELRGTLIKCILALAAAIALVGFNLNAFNEVLMWPLNQIRGESTSVVIDLGTTTIMEGFNVIIQICVVGGIVIAAPFILFFIGQFVAPALTERERRTVLPLLGSGLVLFLSGCTFSFFLLVTSTIRVSASINQMFGYVMRWTPGAYYGLLTWLVLGVGLAFEFPLVIVLLVHLGFMSTALLRKYRRHAIVVIFIIAAIVTPTPDPFTQTIFAAPLYVLFELAIVAGRWVEKRRQLPPAT